MQIEAQQLANALIFLLIVAVSLYNGIPKIKPYLQKSPAAADNEVAQKPKLTIEERVGAMEGELNEVRRERDEARKDRDEATSERDQAREEIGKLRNEFQGKIDDLQRRVDQLELSGIEKDRNIARITAERDAIEKEHKALLIRYTERQDTVISMGNELNDLEIRVEALTIDNKAHKSLDVLVDELSKRFVPALVTAFQDAVRSTSEQPKINTGVNPS